MGALQLVWKVRSLETSKSRSLILRYASRAFILASRRSSHTWPLAILCYVFYSFNIYVYCQGLLIPTQSELLTALRSSLLVGLTTRSRIIQHRGIDLLPRVATRVHVN